MLADSQFLLVVLAVVFELILVTVGVISIGYLFFADRRRFEQSRLALLQGLFNQEALIDDDVHACVFVRNCAACGGSHRLTVRKDQDGTSWGECCGERIKVTQEGEGTDG